MWYEDAVELGLELLKIFFLMGGVCHLASQLETKCLIVWSEGKK